MSRKAEQIQTALLGDLITTVIFWDANLRVPFVFCLSCIKVIGANICRKRDISGFKCGDFHSFSIFIRQVVMMYALN
jgi:hypothetical protein